MESSIFNQETHDNPSTAAIAKKHNAVNEQVKNLASTLRGIWKEADSEPDWQGMLLAAKDSTTKMKIRAAREAYKDEQKFKAFEAQQEAQAAKVTTILTTPQHQRNKSFYEELMRSDPSSYWDVRIQRQKQRDRETMGLGFHLKGSK
jgi:small-conductance mechanosensitive channel